MSSRWIIRFAAVAGFVALTLCLTSVSLAGPSDGPALSGTGSDTQSFGPIPEVQFDAPRRGHDIITTLLTDRAMGQPIGSPFTPPGHNNETPGHTKHHGEGGPPGHNKNRERPNSGSTPD